VADRADGYAAAIFELARAEDEVSRVEREFYSISRSLQTSTELRDALTNPALPAERKHAIVDDLVGGKASRLTTNFVNLVVSQGRVSDLGAIADRLGRYKAKLGGGDIAEIHSAIQLDDATVQRLSQALAKAVGRQVEVRTVVDPSVLGGIVARVGDTVIDGSVRNKLESLRTAMKK
jgi:F-type H+-transporting ATPase subunit delta